MIFQISLYRISFAFTSCFALYSFLCFMNSVFENFFDSLIISFLKKRKKTPLIVNACLEIRYPTLTIDIFSVHPRRISSFHLLLVFVILYPNPVLYIIIISSQIKSLSIFGTSAEAKVSSECQYYQCNILNILITNPN